MRSAVELKQLARAHAAICVESHASADEDAHITSDPLTKEESRYIRKEMVRIAERIRGGRLPPIGGEDAVAVPITEVLKQAKRERGKR